MSGAQGQMPMGVDMNVQVHAPGQACCVWAHPPRYASGSRVWGCIHECVLVCLCIYEPKRGWAATGPRVWAYGTRSGQSEGPFPSGAPQSLHSFFHIQTHPLRARLLPSCALHSLVHQRPIFPACLERWGGVASCPSPLALGPLPVAPPPRSLGPPDTGAGGG